MNELISITYDSTDTPTVSGRELHEKLEIDTNYTTWFKRMCDYGFEENKDYIPKMEDRSDGLPGKQKTDHEMTLDMAKQICMIQRSEIGKKFREYFLEIERAWNTPEQVFARALKMASKQIDALKTHNSKLLLKINEDKPKTIFADAVCASQSSILVGDLAKLIKQNGVDIGQKRLFEYLRENGYLMKSGTSRNLPTQKAMEKKLFQVKESTITNPDGSIRVTKTTKVSGVGQSYFINLFLGSVRV